jgi:hypothetical protein
MQDRLRWHYYNPGIGKREMGKLLFDDLKIRESEFSGIVAVFFAAPF